MYFVTNTSLSYNLSISFKNYKPTGSFMIQSALTHSIFTAKVFLSLTDLSSDWSISPTTVLKYSSSTYEELVGLTIMISSSS